jgi:long-chain acyl-CoA synthetase
MSDPLGLHICPGADLRVSPDGEISVKTEALMEGYLDPSDGSLNLPLENGRFMTGDLGRIDERGVLRLTGRKKDILVLPDGSKISCPEYESLLAEEVGSDDLCVILVSGRPALLYSDRISKAAMETAVTSLNRRYPRSPQIVKLIPREGKLPRTGTGKIMRWVLEKETS